jgi:hypothetical protein
MTAEEAGADGLSVYLSEQNATVRLALIQTMLRQFTGRIKINTAATALAVNIAAELSPAAVCLVAADGGSDGDSRQWMLLRIFRYYSRLSVSCIVPGIAHPYLSGQNQNKFRRVLNLV